MKNINIIKSMILVATLASCNSQLDIQPSQSVDASSALKTAKDVKGTLIGAYANMGASNLYGGGVYFYADLFGGTGTGINFFGTFQGFTQISNKQKPLTNGFVSGVCLNSYFTINKANEELNALSLV